MARRMVSWRGIEPRASAALSSASSVSIVSIDSIAPDRHTMTLEAPTAQPVDLGTKSTSLLGGSNPSTDDSYLRHDIYFFQDGNITFLVRDAL